LNFNETLKGVLRVPKLSFGSNFMKNLEQQLNEIEETLEKDFEKAGQRVQQAVDSCPKVVTFDDAKRQIDIFMLP